MNNLYIDQSQSRVWLVEPTGRLNKFVVLFPYTPTISISGDASYTSYDPTHANFQQKIFQSGTNSEISLIAPIVVRNEAEGKSVLEMANFFRATLKMGFGEQDPNRGMPPPVLRFNMYNVYSDVPVIINGFQWNFENDVDYISFDHDGTTKHLPVSSTFVLSMSTTYAPAKVRSEFTLGKYAAGKLSNKGYI